MPNRDGSEYNNSPDTVPAIRNETSSEPVIHRHENGRWKKGSSGNLSGRPKDSGVNKLIKDMFGPNLEELILLAAEVISYDATEARHRFPKWKAADKLKMVEYLINRVEGTPTQQIKAEVETKQVNVNIDIPDDFNIIDIN